MTDSRRQKILQIMMYATLLNDRPTKKEITDDKPTVFLDFSGHICCCDLQIHRTGWVVDKEPDVTYRIYPDESFSEIQFFGDFMIRPTDDLLETALSEVKELYNEWRNK